MAGWRCTIKDPASGRDAYVRGHGSSYEVAMPTTNTLDDANEAAGHLLVLARSLVLGSCLVAELTPYTDKGFSQVSITQNFGACEVVVLIGVNRAVATREVYNRFEQYVRKLKKPKAPTGGQTP